MTCYRIKIGDSWGVICGRLGAHCVNCSTVSDILCDYPVGKGKTCDSNICDHCATEIAPNLHYCKAHTKEWEDFKLSGGVKKELENVIPFKIKCEK
jgi:hypothetical protein